MNLFPRIPVEVPVLPDGPEAKRWLQDELSKPEYQAAKPSWWDLLMRSIFDWFAGMFSGATFAGSQVVLALIIVVVLALLGLIGYLVYGVPRIRARQRKTGSAPIFDDDSRTLSQLRAAADRAAKAGDWELAIEERFRALVRGLVDRDLISVHPGTTAYRFGTLASPLFPSVSGQIISSAMRFDEVRYLGMRGTAGSYEHIRALEIQVADMPAVTAQVLAQAGAK